MGSARKCNAFSRRNASGITKTATYILTNNDVLS